MFNLKGLIKSFLIALFLGIILPFSLLSLASTHIPFPLDTLINTQILISNGILFIIVYSAYGSVKKENVLSLLMGACYLVLVAYFFTIGHSIYSLYLPLCGFGILCFNAEIGGFTLGLSVNFWWACALIIGLKALNIVRKHIKLTPEEKKELKRE